MTDAGYSGDASNGASSSLAEEVFSEFDRVFGADDSESASTGSAASLAEQLSDDIRRALATANAYRAALAAAEGGSPELDQRIAQLEAEITRLSGELRQLKARRSQTGL